MKFKFTIILILLFPILSFSGEIDTVFSRISRDTITNAKFVKSPIYPFIYKDKAITHYTKKVRAGQAFFTASLVQLVYVGGYMSTQWDNIQKNGSFDNWRKNFTKIHFDKDSYDYNIITHVGNAHYSYLFYRAIGYKKFNSFMMTAIGSTFFEFFIETVTEPPSIQDLWQTPVLGTILGMGTESLALLLINSDYKVAHAFAYVFNPFLLFKGSTYKISPVPIYNENYRGVGLTIKF